VRMCIKLMAKKMSNRVTIMYTHTTNLSNAPPRGPPTNPVPPPPPPYAHVYRLHKDRLSTHLLSSRRRSSSSASFCALLSPRASVSSSALGSRSSSASGLLWRRPRSWEVEQEGREGGKVQDVWGLADKRAGCLGSCRQESRMFGVLQTREQDVWGLADKRAVQNNAGLQKCLQQCIGVRVQLSLWTTVAAPTILTGGGGCEDGGDTEFK
jgi:hypothetical protein